MKPLLAVVVGLLLTVGDLRIGNGEVQPDLLPDPVGWVVVALALGRLAHLHRALRLGTAAAVAGAVVSVPRWPGVIALRGVEDWLGVLSGLAELAVVVAILSGVMAVLPPRRDTARALRTTYVVVAVVFALLALGAQVSVALGVLALMAGLVNLLVLVLVLVFLGSVSSTDPAHISR